MLLWQPQNFLRVRSVFLASIILHALVCFSLLFVYKDYHQRLFVDLSSRIPSHAVVQLLPLSASRPSSSSFAKASEDRQVLGVKGGKKGGVSSSGKAMAGKQKSGGKNKVQQVKKKSPTSLAKQTVASKSVKSGKSKTSSFAKAMEDKEAAKKAKTLLQGKKSSVASSSAKATEDKKAKEDRKVAEELRKHNEKLAQEKKIKEESKPKEPEVVELLKQEVVESSQVSAIDQAITEGTIGSVVGPEGQDILYLTRQELDALQIQQKLQECLFDVWTPPAGIPAEALCEVLVTVGWDGAIIETQFLKKTDILMYDLSVQETVEQVIFPHEVWGKHITIAFKP